MGATLSGIQAKFGLELDLSSAEIQNKLKDKQEQVRSLNYKSSHSSCIKRSKCKVCICASSENCNIWAYDVISLLVVSGYPFKFPRRDQWPAVG